MTFELHNPTSTSRSRPNVINLAVTLTAAMLMLLSQTSRAQNADNVVAKLGATELTVQDVRRMLEAQPVEARLQLTSNPQLMDRFVRTEIFRKALLDEARAKSFDRRPDVIDAMDRGRDQALVTKYVYEISRPPASYPNEQEVADAYKANAAEFTVPAQYRMAQIFLTFGDGAQKKDPESVRKRIDELAKGLSQKPADFDAVARRQSDHKPSAEQGGDLGWVPLDQMVPEVRAVAVELKKNEISKPIRTAAGWHLVKVIDSKPKSMRPMAEVREQIVRALRQRKAQETEQKYLDDLVVRSPLGVNEIALNRLLTPQASAGAAAGDKKP